MEITYRKMTFEEIIHLKRQLITVWGLIEKIGIKWIVLTFVTIFPLMIFERNVSSEIQLIILIVDQILIVGIILFWNKRDPEMLFNKTLKNEIDVGDVEILNIKSDCVYKRKDLGDFGTGYYFDLGSKTLYLQGQHLDLLYQARKFPNSEFEIIRTKSAKVLINCKTRGGYLKPKKTLEAFTKEQYKSGDYHTDGQVIDMKIHEIK